MKEGVFCYFLYKPTCQHFRSPLVGCKCTRLHDVAEVLMLHHRMRKTVEEGDISSLSAYTTGCINSYAFQKNWHLY